MAKFSINRLLETSKFTATKAGAELRDFIDYVSLFSEQTLRALRNQLTFQDNFAAKVRTYTFSHNVDQVIDTNGDTPTGIFVTRVVSSITGVDNFAWWLNDSGQVVVKVGFTGAPSGTGGGQLVILTA